MNPIKISIVTSLYRCQQFLEQFLTHFFEVVNIDECELILIHNDPTEEEVKIIDKFNWQSINMVHLKVEREGLYCSWNRGIKEARGEYIAIWNVDDIRTPDSLLSQRRALENSNAVMCYGDFYGTSTYGQFKERFYEYNEFEGLKSGLLRNHVIGCFPMWRKSIHEEIGFLDEQFRLVSDYEFQLRVLSRYALVKAVSVLGYYLDYSNHKLSSNRFLQDKERTVVEIRYRFYDKVLMHTLPFITKYKWYEFLNFGEWYKASEVVPALNVVKSKDVITFLQMPFSYFVTFSRRGISKLYRTLFQ